MDRTVLRREQVGAVEIIPIVDCTLDFPVGEVWPDADPADPDIANVLDAHQHLQLPVTCFVLRDQDTLILVDTGVGPSPYSGFPFPPGSLFAGLEAISIRPDDIDMVVLTHLHPDHVGWNCDDSGRTTFPNARYIITRIEWEHWSPFAWRTGALRRVGEVLERRVDPLERSGQLHLVAADQELSPSTRLVPLPGHTPGHTGISVCSQRQHALLIGDAMHHPIQCGHPEWNHRFDADIATATRTRRSITDQSATLLLFGSHFPTPTSRKCHAPGPGLVP